MQADQLFSEVSAYAEAMRELHAQRRGRVVSGRSERAPRAVLAKTDPGKGSAKQAGVATSAAEPLMLMLGKRTTF